LSLSLNPLVETDEGTLTTLGCKVEIDDSAVFRQMELSAMMDWSMLLPTERVAMQFDGDYITLQGNIGVITGSAGNCLALNDMIIDFGGRPANFCDLHGQAYHEQIEEMIYLLNEDRQIKVIFFNLFSDALQLEKFAYALKALLKAGMQFKKPIVFRGRGPPERVEKAKSVLLSLNLPDLFIEDDYEKAVRLAVSLAALK